MARIFNKKRKNDYKSDDDAFEIFAAIEKKKKLEIEEKIQFQNATVEPVKMQNSSVYFNSVNSNSRVVQSTVSIEQQTAQIFGNSEKMADFGASGQGKLVGCSTVIGKRASQQDALATTNPYVVGSFAEKWLGVLCDGMGGMNGGEKASSISVRTTIETFRECLTKGEIDVPNYYRRLIEKIDYDVTNLEDEEGRYLGAGTTFISVVIDNGKLYWASVGDSHIYVIRENQIKMIVREHNYFMDLLELVNRGEITYEEACSDKSKDALTSYIGIGGVTLMDVSESPVSLVPGDVILLCSDGLYRSLSDQEILQVVLSNKSDMSMAAEALTSFAMMKNNPYQDNTSVVIAKYN